MNNEAKLGVGTTSDEGVRDIAVYSGILGHAVVRLGYQVSLQCGWHALLRGRESMAAT